MYAAGINSEVLFSNCSFFDNKATSQGTAGSSSGGAIHIDGPIIGFEILSITLVIIHSRFVNNFASGYGTAVYTSHNVLVFISNSSFHYDIRPNDSRMSGLLSASGVTELLEASFKLTNLYSNSNLHIIEIIYINSGINLNLVANCPMWYEVHISRDAVETELNRTTPMIRFMYECKSCTKSFYTGSLRDRKIDYPADGNISLALRNLEEDNHADTCKPCPYGAICTGNNVTPKQNHWGYWHDDELVFVKCPPNTLWLMFTWLLCLSTDREVY